MDTTDNTQQLSVCIFDNVHVKVTIDVALDSRYIDSGDAAAASIAILPSVGPELVEQLSRYLQKEYGASIDAISR